MTASNSRRAVLAKCWGLAPALGLAAVSVPELTKTRAPATTLLGATTIAGTWAATVTFPDNPGFPAEPALTAFTPGGILTAMAGSNPVGFGTWRPTGTSTFELDFRHFTLDSQGNISGEIRVSMQGSLNSPDHFTATGTGAEYDLNGNLLASSPSQLSGTRYGFTVP
jgi:hypothetical protein